jgi:2-oxoglutarate dehydrogenase E2 component (dihydrolipoamide succinyltransferase)
MELAVVMPPMGDAPGELVLSRWFKGPGDHVAKGEPLFEVTTEKVDVAIESLYTGTVTRLLLAEGEAAAEGATIALIQAEAG